MAEVTASQAILPNGAGEDALLDVQVSLDIEIEPEDAQGSRAPVQPATELQIQQNADSIALMSADIARNL